MTNGHRAATATHDAGVSGETSIDDIVNRAADPKHTQQGVDLHQDVLDSRMPLLLDFYKKGLPEAERHSFESLSMTDQVTKLRENNYRLKPELAEQMVRYVAIKVLKAHDETWGKQLEADVNTLYNKPNATKEQKEDALRRIHMARYMLDGLGFHITQLEQIGKLRGFSGQFWQQLTQTIPQQYQNLREEVITSEITPEQAEAYITKTIAPATGIKPKEVLGQGIQEAKSVIVDYARFKKQDRLDQFKTQYRHYHGGAAPAPAQNHG